MADAEEKVLTGAECVNPYRASEAKGKQVEEMFDSIAPAYDFMNTAMTFGLHRWWRNRALSMAARALGPVTQECQILDVATGTGDVAFKLASMFPQAQITGIDLSSGMLRIAEEKLNGHAGLTGRVKFMQADCLSLPFADNNFKLVTVAYGVRNFEYLAKGLREMHRITTPGGVICIIELSTPEHPFTHALYNLYSRRIIPGVGRMVSGDSRAYSYLPESIAAAPQRDALTRLLSDAGFTDTSWRSLTFGAVTIYLAKKPK